MRSHNVVVGGLLLAGLMLAVLPGCSGESSSRSNDNDANTNTNTNANANANSSGPAALSTPSPSWVIEWSKAASDAVMVDHSPAPGETRGEQAGPARAARALAIAHIAMAEAVFAIHGRYKSYAGLAREKTGASTRAAIAAATHAALVALYPGQKVLLDARYDAFLDGEPEGDLRTRGIALGERAAQAILKLRENDGAGHQEPLIGVDYTCSTEPLRWRPDPISQKTVALGARWSQVKPFVIRSASQFRAPAPPAAGTPQLSAAFDEVKRLGGDGNTSATQRTLQETVDAIYWGYDGSPSLGVPPRLYNQIVTLIAVERGTDAIDLARVLALVNVAMADAGLACWESKYFHDFARPVTALREADPFTGGGDPSFTPMGAPATNTAGPNFTPPFPAYPSGHATFGGAVFQVLRAVYKTDAIRFTFVSDELDGTCKDASGQVRPMVTRTFQNLSEAEEANGQSRIYLGIHWSFDKTAGIAMGRQVADAVAGMMYLPTGP